MRVFLCENRSKKSVVDAKRVYISEGALATAAVGDQSAKDFFFESWSIAALAKFSTVLVRPLWREGFGGAGRVATANAIATLTAMMNTPPLKRRCRKAEVFAIVRL